MSVFNSHSLEFDLLFNQVFELVSSSSSSLDHFGFRVHQVVFNEIQAGFDVAVLELDEMQPSRDLLLDRDLVQRVSIRFLLHHRRTATLNSSVRHNRSDHIRSVSLHDTSRDHT